MKLPLNYKLLFENKQKIVRVAIITMLILAALFLFLFRTGNQDEKEMITQGESDSQTTAQTDESIDVIIVDVSGEVKTPSVIELPADSRINDAIQAAGGLTKNADITQINRAAVISDGEKVFIPTKQKSLSEAGSKSNETDSQNSSGITGGTGSPANTGSTQININNASTTELQEIPGIGPVTADKIIKYRTDNGLFRKLEDIKKISGIGDKTFAKMKPYICI